MQSLPQGYNALVLGASGAIGSAMLAHLQGDPRCARCVGLSRSSHPAFDFEDPDSLAKVAEQLRPLGPWHLVVIATGTLHGVHGMPEKRLAQLNYSQMETSFKVNTLGPALAMAHLVPLLPRNGRSLMAVLSAKVGSLGDNRLGGWYSYRASKAALNMLVKTASIELARTHPLAVLASLHPGTVDSALSAPFQGAKIGRPAALAAQELLTVLDGLQAAQTGEFWAYDGQRLPW